MSPVRPRDRFALWVLRAAGALLDRVPLDTAQAMARALARAYVALGGRRLRWTRQNLRIAFPSCSESERERLARASFGHALCNLIDLNRSERWTAEQLLCRFSFEGLEHLEAVLAAKRGVLLLSLHMGCYDLALRALSLRLPGLRLAAIAEPRRSQSLYAWFNERRNDGAVEIISASGNAALRALRVLRSGRPLIVLNDLYSRRGRRVAAPLFGSRCFTSVGPAFLARCAPAAVVPCYVIRDAPDHHTLFILPELALPDGEEAITGACNAALERIIREHPEHWTWAHRRFRYSPDLPAGFYRSVAARIGAGAGVDAVPAAGQRRAAQLAAGGNAGTASVSSTSTR